MKITPKSLSKALADTPCYLAAGYLALVLGCVPVNEPPRGKHFSLVTSPAGATVTLNGTLLEQKTPIEMERVAPGFYHIVISKEGYLPRELDRQINEGLPVVIRESLTPKTGGLYLLTEPSQAEIFIDGQYQGRSPLNLKLVIGRHNVEVKLKNYRREKRYVDIEYDKQATLSFKLEDMLSQPFILTCPDNSECAKTCHGSAGVILTSTPDEALVYLDGRKVGQTPLKIALGAGSYKLLLTKPGYADENITLNLDTPKIVQQDIKLKLKYMEDMVYISEGLFTMGSDQAEPDEAPGHRVYVNKFYIDKYEVTNAQYRRFLDSTGYPPPAGFYDSRLSGDHQPVTGVTWFEAAAYAQWVGKRLPTEAEWEKAARGGQEYTYPWGNQWAAGMCNSLLTGLGITKTVGSFPGGGSGNDLYDMSGNAWEWCADWYDATFYEYGPIQNPKGPQYGFAKVIRGGSYMDDPRAQRTTRRQGLEPSNKLLNVGFRCARDYITVPTANAAL